MALTQPVFRICIHRTLDDEEVHVAIPDVLPHISEAAVRAWRAEPLREQEIARQVGDSIRKAFQLVTPYAVLAALRKWRTKNRLQWDETLVTDAIEGAMAEAEANVLVAWTNSPLRSQGTVAGAEAAIREAVVASLERAMAEARIGTVRL